MEYPLKLAFKKLAIAPQISVLDANGRLLFYVKQKLFKLKESITIFSDREQTQPLYQIKADRVIDFSARYHFMDQQGNELGSIKRRGARSLWKAHYDIFDNTQAILTIQEENAWIKMLDAFFSEIPLLGLFAGYVFNPTFLISRAEQNVVMRVKKQPSFLESSFLIEKTGNLDQNEELQILLGTVMMVLLERARG